MLKTNFKQFPSTRSLSLDNFPVMNGTKNWKLVAVCIIKAIKLESDGFSQSFIEEVIPSSSSLTAGTWLPFQLPLRNWRSRWNWLAEKASGNIHLSLRLAMKDLFSMKRVAIPLKINDSTVNVSHEFQECIRASLHKNAEVKVKNQIA
jgi:hypothetical protein